VDDENGSKYILDLSHLAENAMGGRQSLLPQVRATPRAAQQIHFLPWMP